MVINTQPRQYDWIMSVILWLLAKIHFVNGLPLLEVEKVLRDNPSSESKEEFSTSMKKASYFRFH